MMRRPALEREPPVSWGRRIGLPLRRGAGPRPQRAMRRSMVRRIARKAIGSFGIPPAHPRASQDLPRSTCRGASASHCESEHSWCAGLSCTPTNVQGSLPMFSVMCADGLREVGTIARHQLRRGEPLLGLEHRHTRAAFEQEVPVVRPGCQRRVQGAWKQRLAEARHGGRHREGLGGAAPVSRPHTRSWAEPGRGRNDGRPQRSRDALRARRPRPAG